MQDNNGFIKIYRQMLDWEWYDDTNTKIVFLHILLKANFKDVKWRGINIPAGSFLSTYKALEKDLKLTARQVRTAIEHLKMTGEIETQGISMYNPPSDISPYHADSAQIKNSDFETSENAQKTTHQTTFRFTIFTVRKWDDFQGLPTEQTTMRRQCADNAPTNNNKNDIRMIKNDKEQAAGNLSLSSLLEDSDFQKICQTWGRCSVQRVSERTGEELYGLATEYGTDNLCQAILTAADQNKVTLAYVKGILKNKSQGTPKKSWEQQQLELRRAEIQALREQYEREEKEAAARSKNIDES